ncbi:hypothetical protein VF21_05431 [Pseudogymnoascus sp. 05NY08]|nr:hypothetical protein VF21_05431 [Pseudogymnoascus sp. 05NY08]
MSAAKSQYQAPPLRLTADAGNAPTDMSHVRSAPSAACQQAGRTALSNPPMAIGWHGKGARNPVKLSDPVKPSNPAKAAGAHGSYVNDMSPSSARCQSALLHPSSTRRSQRNVR